MKKNAPIIVILCLAVVFCALLFVLFAPGIKNENNESFIHGDLCLPNILVDDNDEIVAIIDLAHATFSNDLWLDYAWIIWSFEYNISSKKYTDDLLKALNIKFDQEKFNKIINNE